MKQQIGKRIKDRVRQGRLMPATVIDAFSGEVTVRISYNGAIMRKLKVVGGPVEKGQSVQVDFTTVEPTVVAVSKEWLTNEDLEKALAALLEEGLNADTVITITLFSGGAAFEMYPSTPEGLALALATAGNGDVVWLPDIDITSSSIVISEGVTLSGISKRQSILRGPVTLGSGASLENLCVINGEYTANEVIGITVPALADRCFIRHCEIHGYNCGGGNGIAIDVAAGGKVNVEHSQVIGDSSNGSAWAVRGVSGSECRVYFSTIFGKTDTHTGSGMYEYSNVQHESEIKRGCILTGEVRNGYAAGNACYNALVSGGAFMNPSQVVQNRDLTNLHNTPNNYAVYATPILRAGDYIYICNQDENGGSNDVTIIEFDTMTNSSKSLTASSYYEIGGNSFFCVGVDRKVYATYKETFATGRCVVYELDFENDTSTEIHGWQDGDNPGTLLTPEMICFIPDINNQLHLVIYGSWYGTVANPNSLKRNGIYVQHYDFATDTWVTETGYYSTDLYGTVEQWYSGPAQWENKLCMFPNVSVFTAEDGDGNEVNVAPNGMYVFCVWMFDVVTRNLTKLYREAYGIDDWTGVPDIGIAGVCTATGEVMISYKNGDGSNTDFLQHLYRWDIDSDNKVHIEKANTSSGFYFYQGKNDIYIHNVSVYSPWSSEAHLGSDWSLLDDDFSIYPGASRFADDDNRSWYYSESDEKIYGIKQDDDTNVLSFSLPKSEICDEVGSDTFSVVVLGDFLGILAKEGLISATRTHHWLVRPAL